MICCEIVVKMLQRWYFSFNSLQRDNTYINTYINIYIYIYIQGHVSQPKLKMYGILDQHARYNKFVESGSNSQVLVYGQQLTRVFHDQVKMNWVYQRVLVLGTVRGAFSGASCVIGVFQPSFYLPSPPFIVVSFS